MDSLGITARPGLSCGASMIANSVENEDKYAHKG